MPPLILFLKFTSCCDNTVLYFKRLNSGLNPGVYSYLGIEVNGLKNVCYSIETFDIGTAPILNFNDYDNLPTAPTYTEDVTYNTLTLLNTNCSLYVKECPECDSSCYTLYGCSGTIGNTNTNLSAYLNQFISINAGGGIVDDTFYVTLNEGVCDNVVAVTFNAVEDPCDCKCYEIVGNASKIQYLDCDGNLVKTFGSAKFCSINYPLVRGVTGQYSIVENGNCIDNECPDLCIKLTNCSTDEILYTNNQILSQYIGSSSVVELVGHDGCWVVSKSLNSDCQCPIDVTVSQVFEDCISCLPIIAYKFINCDNSLLIKYSTENYSNYVSKTVKLECGGCWNVEEINYIPPNTQLIEIVDTYNNCSACKAIYYKLTNCLDDDIFIITTVNLNAYLNNTITIKNCDSCWTVAITTLHSNVETVIVNLIYDDCEECLINIPCVCSTITNNGNFAFTYTYLDCDLTIQSITIQPGITSAKVCLIKWNDLPLNSSVIYYGNCVDQICPPVIYKKRFIKPGYFNLTCNIEKYEKYACNSSEIIYKQVLEKRYGISNCCPNDENNQKWMIKKELADLQGSKDADYNCTLIQNCCDNIPDCNCH